MGKVEKFQQDVTPMNKTNCVGDQTWCIASAGLIGLEAHHGKAEILYVVLESIAFGMMQLMEVMKKECDYMTQNSKIG